MRCPYLRSSDHCPILMYSYLTTISYGNLVCFAVVCEEGERIPSSQHTVQVTSNENLKSGVTSADEEQWTPANDDNSPAVTLIFKVSTMILCHILEQRSRGLGKEDTVISCIWFVSIQFDFLRHTISTVKVMLFDKVSCYSLYLLL